MLEEEEKRESSPEAPMVMLMPTQAPVVPPVPIEVRRDSLVKYDQQEGASVLDKTKETETDDGPDILIGSNASGGVLDQADAVSHPPAPAPPKDAETTSHPPAPAPSTSHPPAPVPSISSHPPAPSPAAISPHPPAPVPAQASSPHPPAPSPKPANSLIAVETRQGIGRIVETEDNRLQAEFLPSQIWPVDLSSCIPLIFGATMFSPYGPCQLLAITGECALVVKLQSGETVVIESRSCQSEYRYYYNKTLEALCFGNRLESELAKTIPFTFLTNLRFQDVERKVKVSLDQHGRRIFALRI